MKFLTYILAFIFSVQAQAHNDHFLGEGIAHDVIHTVLFFLLVAIAVTGFKWMRKKIKAS
jgi:DMSO/TMAO reductase YedYZ heme-binding membrane subunit